MKIASIKADIVSVKEEDVPEGAQVYEVNKVPEWIQKVLIFLPNPLVRVDYKISAKFGTFSGKVFVKKI